MLNRLRAFWLALFVFGLAGCGAATVEPTQTPTAAATRPPTAAPAANITPDAAPTLDSMAVYRGQNVFNGGGQCFSCHTTNGGRSLGPDLKGIAARLSTEGLDAAAYLHESIVDVLAVVPDGFRGDLMPQNYASMLTPEQVDDLVQYMMSL